MIKRVLFLLLFCSAAQLLALPRFALLTGAQCADCHVNPTGGMLRSSGGWGYEKNVLKMWNTYKDGEEPELSPMIGKNIRLGFDFRSQYLAAFGEGKSRSDFQNMTGSVYLGATLSEKLEITSRYDYVWGIWEAYAVGKILPFNGYLKAGTFQPNFGLKVDDHTAYTRGGDMGKITTASMGLPYEATYTETGIEAGFDFASKAFFTVSAAHANNSGLFSKEPVYTANLMITAVQNENVNAFLGSSYAAMQRSAFASPAKLNSSLLGFYGGIGIGKLSLLAELDKASNYYEKDEAMTALMIEASYGITKGLGAVVRFDSFNGDDPNMTDDTKIKLSHIIIGAEWFPYNFIEVRPQFRINSEDPDKKNNAFVMQFHFFY